MDAAGAAEWYLSKRRRISQRFDGSAGQVRDEKLGRSFVAGDHARAGGLGRRRNYVLSAQRGQGLPLAQSLAPNLIADGAAIIYAQSLPEKSAYERLGYRTFFPRSDAVARLVDLAKAAGRPLALCFVNTIQHNNFNYHDP